MSIPLTVNQTGPDTFEGISPYTFLPRYYGGELMAQAVLSGGKTVENGFVLHCLSASFLKDAVTERPLIHQVLRLKDARRFSVRQVNITQDTHLIFTAILSFQVPEKGVEHQSDMPDVPMPEDIEPDEERFLREAPDDLKKLNPLARWPFDFREIDPAGMFRPEKKPAVSAIWLKSKTPIPDDPLIQQAMLTFASDSSFLATALRPHGLGYWAGNAQQASLCHSIWFHRPFRADEWMLFAIESPTAFGGRGIVYGNIFTRDGKVAATAIQEGVIRAI